MIDYEYIAEHFEQEKALDEAVEYGLKQGWKLASIIYKETKDEKHIFIISYNE